MYEYRIVYGGQQTVKASSTEEAYEQFWAWIRQRCDAHELGLIVEVKEASPCQP